MIASPAIRNSYFGTRNYWKPTDFILPIFNKLTSMVTASTGNDV